MKMDSLFYILIVLMIVIIVKSTLIKKNTEKILYESSTFFLFKAFSILFCSIIINSLMKLWLVVSYGKSIVAVFDLQYIYILILSITLWSSLIIKGSVITNKGVYHKVGINRLKKICNLDEISVLKDNSDKKIIMILKNGKKRGISYGGNTIEKKKIEKVICYIIEKSQEQSTS